MKFHRTALLTKFQAPSLKLQSPKRRHSIPHDHSIPHSHSIPPLDPLLNTNATRLRGEGLRCERRNLSEERRLAFEEAILFALQGVCKENVRNHLLIPHIDRGSLIKGLPKGGLARKAPVGPKRALSGQFLLFPRGCDVRRNWSQSAKEAWKDPNQRFSRKDFAPILRKFGLKPPFVSPLFRLSKLKEIFAKQYC